MSNKPKKATSTIDTSQSNAKRVRKGVPSPSYPESSPRWSFALIDHQGPFGWKKLLADQAIDICRRLAAFEKMSWVDIQKGGSHYVEHGLQGDAIGRLQELQQDDNMDLLFSLRVSGRERVWGIRLENTFYFLWWDPEHAVCLSQKKHT